jgi:hypothetical protein
MATSSDGTSVVHRELFPIPGQTLTPTNQLLVVLDAPLHIG